MKTQILIIGLAALLTAGCASNGIAPMGSNTYMINRGGWPHMNGFAVESECYRDANQFCTEHGLFMVPVSATTIDGQVLANNASCKLIFRAVASTNDPAYKAYQNGKFNAADYRVPLPKELSLEAAYQNGSLSAAEYFQLKNQRDAQSQAYLQQLQSAQRQQQQDIQKSLEQTAARAQRSYENVELQSVELQSQPILPNIGLMSQPNLTSGLVQQPPQIQEHQPSLPAAYDMPKSSDMQTGKTKLGPDGRLWHEYRTASGSTTYWRLAQ
jgi:hypothetical protein